MERPDLTINVEQECARIERFIQDQVRSFRRDGVVLALSGGVDTSLTAVMAVRALGSDKVLGLITPERDSDPESYLDARLIVERLGISSEIHRISGVLSKMGVYSAVPSPLLATRERQEHYVREFVMRAERELNRPLLLAGMQGVAAPKVAAHLAYTRAKNRVRMAYLYFRAEVLNLLVATSTTRSEWLTGLFVKHGDAAGDVAPISHLYKTQVQQLAEYLQVPDRILAKEPSPGLAPGLLDADLLGMSYEALDPVLAMMERGAGNDEVAQAVRVPVDKVQFVRDLLGYSEHMRQVPVRLEPQPAHATVSV